MKKRLMSIFLALVMVLCLAPMTAMAEGEDDSIWDIADGDITITATAGGQTVAQGDKSLTDPNPLITGSSDQYVLTITAESDTTAYATLSDLTIQMLADRDYSTRKAAISTSGAGKVTIELDNTNKLTGGFEKAGIEKTNGGMLTICDDNAISGSLDVTGGYMGAGIGGSHRGNGSNITIAGGTIKATGGSSSAGIGGGCLGDGTNITIAGGTVTAIGGSDGAGIGGGAEDTESGGDGSNIVISGGLVVAKGGERAAGIGGGGSVGRTYSASNGSNIVISGGRVTAIGGKYGAGIGGGSFYRSVTTFGGQEIVRGSGGYGKDITITQNAQVKVQGGAGDNGEVAAGIGNGVGFDITYADEGQETGDFSGLTEGGFVEYYAAEADISTAEASYVCHFGNTIRHTGDITVTEAVEATCVLAGNTLGITCSGNGMNCGTVLASKTIGILPHSFKIEWTAGETSHWHECQKCGAKSDEAEHTDTDVKDHLCDVCGMELGKCIDNLTHVAAKAASVDEEGNIEYWLCNVCGKYFSDKSAENEIEFEDTVIAKLATSSIKDSGQTETVREKKASESTSEMATTESPQTDDDRNVSLWLALLFAGGGAVAAARLAGKKKKYNR